MGNTRFVTTNLAIGATLLNGTGGGAPIVEEMSGRPMTNALQHDRSTLWQIDASPTNPFDFDIDLGANRAFDGFGLHGLRVPAGTAISSVELYSASSAGGYPAGLGLRGSISPGTSRDKGATISSVSHRYARWRFNFSVAATFTLGKLLLGAVVDLGHQHFPGSGVTPFRYRSTAEGPSGVQLLNDFGDNGQLWALRFDRITATVKDQLAALAALTGSFTYIDPDGNFWEVITEEGRVALEHVFGSTWSVQLSLRRLP